MLQPWGRSLMTDDNSCFVNEVPCSHKDYTRKRLYPKGCWVLKRLGNSSPAYPNKTLNAGGGLHAYVIERFIMIDEGATLAAIERVWKIEWRPTPARLGSQAALMREYLRRSALVAETLGVTADWPWFDAAVHLTLPGVEKHLLPGYVFLDPEPDFHGPGTDPLEDKIIALNKHLTEIPFDKGFYGRKSAWWYIRWASVKNHPALVPLDLPDLYEPLIAFHERGGWFKPEQGYLDLGGATVTMAGRRSAAEQMPLPSLDPQALDRLDEAKITPRKT